MLFVRNKRKAAELTINIMIIAVIGLIVLVVLVALLTGRLGSFGGGLKSFGDAEKTCADQEGDTDLYEECPDGQTSILSSDAAGRGMECCRSSG